MEATESNNGQIALKKCNGPILMHIYDKQCEIIFCCSCSSRIYAHKQFVNHPRQNVSLYGHSQVYEDLKRIHHICLDRLDQTPPARDSIP